MSSEEVKSQENAETSTNEEKKENEVKCFRKCEIEKHNDRNSCWIIIENVVYDVTSFLDEHPGGEEVIIENGGKDSTQDFEDVGHSSDAKQLLSEFKIGVLHEDDRIAKKTKRPEPKAQEIKSCNNQWKSWLIPFGLAIVTTIAYRYFVDHRS